MQRCSKHTKESSWNINWKLSDNKLWMRSENVTWDLWGRPKMKRRILWRSSIKNSIKTLLSFLSWRKIISNWGRPSKKKLEERCLLKSKIYRLRQHRSWRCILRWSRRRSYRVLMVFVWLFLDCWLCYRDARNFLSLCVRIYSILRWSMCTNWVTLGVRIESVDLTSFVLIDGIYQLIINRLYEMIR